MFLKYVLQLQLPLLREELFVLVSRLCVGYDLLLIFSFLIPTAFLEIYVSLCLIFIINCFVIKLNLDPIATLSGDLW